MGLQGTIIAKDALTGDDIAAMLALMQKYYENVSPQSFMVDLNNKESVILLRERGEIKGFSTQRLHEHDFRGERLRVLYSGDTIIDERNRNSRALPITWGRMMLHFLEQSPNRKIYWLLTSKGYKTYRFLSVFFKTFYPCYAAKTPPYEAELMAELGSLLFGDAYVSERNILRSGEISQRLKAGVAEVTPSRIEDPHIAHFVAKNPNHAVGDELVCLARFAPDNLTDFIHKRL